MTLALATRGHLIGGEQVPARSGATFESLDPATAQPFAVLAAGDADDVDAAVHAARTAQRDWADLDPYERGRILQRLADLLASAGSELAELEARDVPQRRAGLHRRRAARRRAASRGHARRGPRGARRENQARAVRRSIRADGTARVAAAA